MRIAVYFACRLHSNFFCSWFGLCFLSADCSICCLQRGGFCVVHNFNSVLCIYMQMSVVCRGDVMCVVCVFIQGLITDYGEDACWKFLEWFWFVCLDRGDKRCEISISAHA